MLIANLNLPMPTCFALIWTDTASRGLAIAITGMLIVACALLLICLFISSLPKVLAAVATIWPEAAEPHTGKSHTDSLVLEDESVLAGIGFVLHQRLQEQSGATQNTEQT